MTVWVCGAKGEQETPVGVFASFEDAMAAVLRMFVAPQVIEHEGYSHAWTFVFIDGEPDQRRFTTDIVNDDGTVHHLYVESYDFKGDR